MTFGINSVVLFLFPGSTLSGEQTRKYLDLKPPKTSLVVNGATVDSLTINLPVKSTCDNCFATFSRSVKSGFLPSVTGVGTQITITSCFSTSLALEIFATNFFFFKKRGHFR